VEAQRAGDAVSVHFNVSTAPMIADLVVTPDGAIAVSLATEETVNSRDLRRAHDDVEDLRRRLQAQGISLGELQINGQRIALSGISS
jgi:hypothetical protein